MGDGLHHDDGADPDWGRLPHDPVGFFSLGEGYQRADLKRAYNALLRRYKPEKHPQEFQRVRAAYEQLERELRYGQASAPRQRTPPPETVNNEPVTNKADESVPSEAVPRERDPSEIESFDGVQLGALARRLESGEATAASLYEELRNQPEKSPDDYYALALLSDAAPTSHPRPFLRWLLQGLAVYPQAVGLGRLAYGALATQTPHDQLADALIECSRAVGGDAFYALTEGAWDRLLRENDFEHFRQTLQACEANLARAPAGDGAIAARLAFYLHALRHALWKDPGDWKERTLEYVSEHFDQCPPQLVDDLDSLDVVRDYLATRDAFVAGSSLRRRLDSVLEAYFTGDPINADREMIAVQLAIASNPDQVAEAFPINDEDRFSSFYSLWAWVATDAAARLAPGETAELDTQFWSRSTVGLLSDLKARTTWDSVVWGVAGGLRGPAWVLGAIVGCVALFLACTLGVAFAAEGLGVNTNTDVAWIAIGLIAIAALFAFYIAYRGATAYLDRRCWNWFCERMALRCYRRHWRPPLFDFVRRSLLDYFLFRDLTAHAAGMTQDERTWISHLVSRDYGLAVYALSLRFLG